MRYGVTVTFGAVPETSSTSTVPSWCAPSTNDTAHSYERAQHKRIERMPSAPRSEQLVSSGSSPPHCQDRCRTRGRLLQPTAAAPEPAAAAPERAAAAEIEGAAEALPASSRWQGAEARSDASRSCCSEHARSCPPVARPGTEAASGSSNCWNPFRPPISCQSVLPSGSDGESPSSTRVDC